MRRFATLAVGIVGILAALPLLPGPGALIVMVALAAIEREFPSLAPLLDRSQRYVEGIRLQQLTSGLAVPSASPGRWRGGRRARHLAARREAPHAPR